MEMFDWDTSGAKPVDTEVFDWDTSGAKPLHGPPQGLSRGAGDHRLDSVSLKGARVRAVRARAQDRNRHPSW